MFPSNHEAYPGRTVISRAFSWLSSRRRVAPVVVAVAILFCLTGCHSALVDATVSNDTAAPISLVQVEYPTASFGIQALVPGQDFHYRFKILGSGAMKITYTDASQTEHKATGPTLQEGQEGTLHILVNGQGVEWQPIVQRK